MAWVLASSGVTFVLEVLMMPATSSAAVFWSGAYCTVVAPRCWSAALVTCPRANPPPPSWSATWAASPGTVVPLSTATVTSARLTAGPPVEPEVRVCPWDDTVFGLLAGVPPSSPPPKTWVTRRTTSTTPATAPRTIPMILRGSPSSVSPSRRSAPRGGTVADGGWRRRGAAVGGRAVGEGGLVCSVAGRGGAAVAAEVGADAGRSPGAVAAPAAVAAAGTGAGSPGFAGESGALGGG